MMNIILCTEADPMSWPEHQKAETKRRIVAAAAAAFRSRGVDGVSVADVMRKAGLTHGGFYAHFATKDDLVAEALALASEETISRLDGGSAESPAGRGIRPVVDAYLSEVHLAHPEHGCPLATLGPELARGPRRTRRTLAAGIKQRIQWLRDRIPGQVRDDIRQQQAVGALACMVGGMILARALEEKDARSVLDACRAFLDASLIDEPASRAARPPRRAV